MRVTPAVAPHPVPDRNPVPAGNPAIVGRVTERNWIGSWLNGPQIDGRNPAYPGEGFGLPEAGPRSVAPMVRRFLALLIDWLLCTVISLAAFHTANWTL